jgi:hypothetical protein
VTVNRNIQTLIILTGGAVAAITLAFVGYPLVAAVMFAVDCVAVMVLHFLKRPERKQALLDAHVTDNSLWVGYVKIVDGERAIAGSEKVAQSKPAGWITINRIGPVEFTPDYKSHRRGYRPRGFHWHATVSVVPDPKRPDVYEWTVKTPDGTFVALVLQETGPLEPILNDLRRKPTS